MGLRGFANYAVGTILLLEFPRSSVHIAWITERKYLQGKPMRVNVQCMDLDIQVVHHRAFHSVSQVIPVVTAAGRSLNIHEWGWLVSNCQRTPKRIPELVKVFGIEITAKFAPSS